LRTGPVVTIVRHRAQAHALRAQLSRTVIHAPVQVKVPSVVQLLRLAGIALQTASFVKLLEPVSVMPSHAIMDTEWTLHRHAVRVRRVAPNAATRELEGATTVLREKG